jgi:hypothetical protein
MTSVVICHGNCDLLSDYFIENEIDIDIVKYDI